MPNRKILILVLSYAQEPFLSLMRAQQKTWAAQPEENIEIFFYHGGDRNDSIDKGASTELEFDITDEYYYMAGKFKRALQFVFDLGIDFDLMFRTNSSSYVNIKKLKQFCATLPTEKIYGGWTIGPDINHDGGYCVSGAGIFLSKNYADILRKEIDEKEQIEEDVLIGRILRKHGARPFDDQSRLDYVNSPHLLEVYHVRFKTGNRLKDAQNMIDYHKTISR